MDGRRWFWLVVALTLLLVVGLLVLPRSAAPPPPSSSPSPSGRPAPPAIEEEAAQRDPVPDLDEVLRLFSDCGMEEPLASIFRQMTVIDQETFESRQGRPIRIPGLARPLAPTFRRTVTGTDHGEEREVVALLPLTGQWLGLRVAGLRLSYFEESDVSAREIHFREPAERVRQVLNRNGFALPAIGQVSPVGSGEGMETLIGVDRTQWGSTLQCATG